jgi:hypothetical protein
MKKYLQLAFLLMTVFNFNGLWLKQLLLKILNLHQ